MFKVCWPVVDSLTVLTVAEGHAISHFHCHFSAHWFQSLRKVPLLLKSIPTRDVCGSVLFVCGML